MSRRNWTRDELILAFNLYYKIPFGKIHHNNPKIISLAKLISRTPSAVSWKLSNIARLDPHLKKRGIVGAAHGSKADIEIWEEFNGNWEKLAFESERLLAKQKNLNIEDTIDLTIKELPKKGKEREQLVRTRVNQQFFRKIVIAAYNNQCCITGLRIPDLLNASHIIPWSQDEENRMNPKNGLCLNVLHDRAFDRGLITITPDYRIKISKIILKFEEDIFVKLFLLKNNKMKISPPNRFLPDKYFLQYHNENIFRED